jgi:sirohydrochlorin ferrochelatase
MLVSVAHGTRNLAGNLVARELTERAATRLGVEAVAAYVELCDPLFADVVGRATEPVVAIPLLLSTGYHVKHDLPAAADAAPVPVRLGPPLGPDPLLAQAQVARLREAGAQPGQRVVLVAAGSSDEAATCDQTAAVALLARAWEGPVELATLSGHGRRPADVVRPDDAVSPYLLSPGHFHDRVRRESGEGAVVAEVIGAHRLVVDLVVARAEALG